MNGAQLVHTLFENAVCTFDTYVPATQVASRLHSFALVFVARLDVYIESRLHVPSKAHSLSDESVGS